MKSSHLAHRIFLAATAFLLLGGCNSADGTGKATALSDEHIENIVRRSYQ